ncbi:MAG: PDZ domain-containing protein [Stenotrophomonas sp.]|jgi:C-terminal processing protease CtpA/Prc
MRQTNTKTKTKTRITTLLLSLLLASAPALAATQTDTARLEWRDAGHHLVVDARDGIVRVTTTEPSSYFGVRSGDRILRVDGQPVRRMADLTHALVGNKATRVPVVVLRKGDQVTVDVDTAAWSEVLAVETPPIPQPATPPRAGG